MSYNIVALTSTYLKPKIEELICELNIESKITVVSYENFQTICQLYDEYAEITDGFIVSGSSAQKAIQLVPHKIQRPLLSLEMDLAGLYRSLLNVFLDDPKTDIDRIIFDFMVPMGIGYTARSFLGKFNPDDLPDDVDNWSKNLTVKDIHRLEKQILEKVVELWEAKRIDLVLCQYSNLIPFYKNHGIAYLYPAPSKQRLRGLIKELEEQIELGHMRENLPAIINISPFSKDQNKEEGMIQEIHTVMKSLLTEKMIEGSIIVTKNHCSVLTTAKWIQKITKNMTSCGISLYLVENLPFHVRIGYGIGRNYDEAANKSYQARLEANNHGKSFLINEKDMLIGPLDSENCMVIDGEHLRKIGIIAKDSNLSVKNVKRVINCLISKKMNRLTAQELADSHEIGIRNANRILSNLEKAGYAKQSTSPSSNSKGRPTKIYDINI